MAERSITSKRSSTLPLRAGMDWLLWALSIYFVPLLIAIVSIAALVLWENQYAYSGGKALEFKVISAADGPLQPAEALPLVEASRATTHFDTRRSEAPVWFAFLAQRPADGQGLVEFPSRHAVEMACWDRSNLQPLGESTRSTVKGALAPVKAGFALQMDKPSMEVLCRASFVGPARLTAIAWPAQALQRSVHEFHRKSGLLDGGLIVLAVFVLMTALINRQSIYVLFAAWLVMTLRMGAITAGWDVQWLGHLVPADWLIQGRSVTVAIYGLLMLTLYRKLFHEELAKTRYAEPLRIAQWLCLPFLLVSFFLSYRYWQPVMWLVTGTGVVLMAVTSHITGCQYL